MEMHRIAAIGLALLSFGEFLGSAAAADLPGRIQSKAPVVPTAVYNWTGCYVGANVGGGWSRTRQEFAPSAGVLFSDSSGVVGGAQIGCDYQFERFVIGGQGQFEFGRINSSAIEPLFPTFTSAAQTKHIYTATARAGYLVAPSVLAYVKGGASWIQTYLSVTGSVPIPFLSESVTLNRSGWSVGGGAEWMFAPGWSLFAECNFMDFGNAIANYVNGPSTVGTPNVVSAKLIAETALVGVNYKRADRQLQSTDTFIIAGDETTEPIGASLRQRDRLVRGTPTSGCPCGLPCNGDGLRLGLRNHKVRGACTVRNNAQRASQEAPREVRICSCRRPGMSCYPAHFGADGFEKRGRDFPHHKEKSET
jgi:outer membrane immunogenic protein